MRFFIAIPTYNRPELLRETVDSIMAQSHEDWRILVSDNQSSTPVPQVLGNRMADPRLRVIRQKEHVPGTEHARRICAEIVDEPYDYLSFTADDDYMVPGALAHIAALSNPSQMVVGNIGYFYQKSGKVVATASNYTTETVRIDARRALIRDTFRAGIRVDEPRASDSEVPENHASFIYLHYNLMQKLNRTFGGFLVEPFGDVGLGRANAFIDHYTYVTRPTGVIRFFNNYGQGQADRRALHAHHRIEFRYSPLKHVSFANCTAESYLTVLSDLGITSAQALPTLFFRHIKEVLKDKPANLETLKALAQAIPFVVGPEHLLQTFAFLAQDRRAPDTYRNTLAQPSSDIAAAAAALLDQYDARRRGE